MKKIGYILIAAAILLAAWLIFKQPTSGVHPNVILITLDTTRADALGFAGNSKVHTPVMDALAKSGTIFSNCTSHSSITLPSHSSILTGQIPPLHGVHNNSSYRLSQDAVTLPEVLQEHGYATGAFLGSVILLKEFGLNQGFDVYDDEIVHYKSNTEKRTIVTRRAEDTMTRAWNWIQKQKQPFFSWIHCYDPHMPYEAPSPFKEAYADNPYFGEIAYTDLQIGRLVNHLKQKGLLENTIIIITGDHGDSFGEHDEITHGLFCYRSTTHVPLFFSIPLKDNESEKIHYPVSSVDILPTILTMLDIPLPKNISGQNLLDASPRSIYSETYIPFESFYFSPVLSIKTDQFSFYKSSEFECYQLTDDPNELNNRVNDHQDELRYFKEQLADIESKAKTTVEEFELDLEMIELLKSLGYVQDGGTYIDHGDDPFSLPAPIHSTKVFKTIQHLHVFESNYPFKVIEEMESLLEEFPDYIGLLTKLGEFKMKIAPEEALVHLEKAAHLRPGDPRLHNLYGHALFNNGYFQKSLEEFKVALELKPTQIVARYNAARVLLEMGQIDLATWNFNKVLEDNPNDIFTLNNLSFIALNHEKNTNKAFKLIDRAFRANPKHPLIKKNHNFIKTLISQNDINKR